MRLFSTNPTLSGIAGHVQEYSLEALPRLVRDPHYSFLLAFNSDELNQNKAAFKGKLSDHGIGDIDLVDCIQQGIEPKEHWLMFSFSLPSILDKFTEKKIYVYRSRTHKAWIIVRTDLLDQLLQAHSSWWEQGIAIGTIYQQHFQESILDYCERICVTLNAWDPSNARDAREKKRIISRFKNEWAELGASAQIERDDHMRRHGQILNSIERAEANAQSEVDYHAGNEAEIPATVRISARTPASNLKLIASLIGPAKVDAVFDPYLDNKGLVALGNILSLGVIASSPLRMLSTVKSQALNEQFLADWLKEHGISGEVRRMSDPEHGRFLLLSNGKSLRLGPSLNGLHNNEAAHLDPIKEDLEFFDSVWAKAQPFVSEKKNVAINTEKEIKTNRILEDWKEWQEDHFHALNEKIKEGYYKIADNEGHLVAWISRKFLKEFPTAPMLEKHQREKTRMSRHVARKLEDLHYSSAEIGKMMTAQTIIEPSLPSMEINLYFMKMSRQAFIKIMAFCILIALPIVFVIIFPLLGIFSSWFSKLMLEQLVTK
ncbi:MAG: hypothetical protein PHZ00_01170 [Candidatus Peribacteraceae bacterium]|nr:hypothetical protein [Candidatus Peribacteraceae bacterium]